MMHFLHLGQHKLKYIANDSEFVIQASNLVDLFLGGRKTTRAIKFMIEHSDRLKVVGHAKYLDVETLEGPFLSAIPPESYEYLHATEFIKVIRSSLKLGDLMPKFIPDPLDAGVNPRLIKKVMAPSARKRPRPHAAAEDDGRQYRPEKKEPLEITLFDPSVIASVGGHAVVQSMWQKFGGNVWEFSKFVYSVMEAKSSAEAAKSKARVEALREEVEEALARQRQLDIKTAAEEAKSKARVEALREEVEEALARQRQLDIKTAEEAKLKAKVEALREEALGIKIAARPAETVRILLNVQKCRANNCAKDTVNGNFCTFHEWN